MQPLDHPVYNMYIKSSCQLYRRLYTPIWQNSIQKRLYNSADSLIILPRLQFQAIEKEKYKRCCGAYVDGRVGPPVQEAGEPLDVRGNKPLARRLDCHKDDSQETQFS